MVLLLPFGSLVYLVICLLLLLLLIVLLGRFVVADSLFGLLYLIRVLVSCWFLGCLVCCLVVLGYLRCV